MLYFYQNYTKYLSKITIYLCFIVKKVVNFTKILYILINTNFNFTFNKCIICNLFFKNDMQFMIQFL